MFKYTEKHIENVFTKLRDRYWLYRYVFPFTRRNKNREINPQNTICLFSHSRSGSTWLAELLGNIPKTVYFDEPLHRGIRKSMSDLPDPGFRKIQGVKDLNFYYEQPIPVGEEWPEAHQIFKELFGGRTVSIGLYRESGLHKLLEAENFIVKFNFGHLLMDWLIRNFNISSILLVRHPLAVISSQLRYISNIKTDTRIPEFPFNTIYQKYNDIYESISSVEEFLAFQWSIKIKETVFNRNFVNTCIKVAYENLVLNFDEEINRIFGYLDIPIPGKIAQFYQKPSISTFEDSKARIAKKEQIGYWKENLSKNQIRKIRNILDLFEIDLYSENPEPDYRKLYL